jgi:glutamyl-tRNA synthetase
LSKRHGATSVQEYRDRGYAPDAVVNYLALLGWALDDKTEFFTRESLIEKFSLKRVSKNPAAFDEEKLRHINAEHFKRLDPMDKARLVYNKLVEKDILPADFHAAEWHLPEGAIGGYTFNGDIDPAHKNELPRLGFIINVMGNRLTGVGDVPQLLRYFFKDDYPRDDDAYEKHLGDPAVAERLERLADAIEQVESFGHADIERAVRGLAADMSIKAGELIHPCRVALTGHAVSPDIFAVIQLIGRSKSIERLRAAARDVRQRQTAS